MYQAQPRARAKQDRLYRPRQTRALKFFDERRDWWVAEEGEFEVLVGPTLKDLKHKTLVTLEKTLIWKGDRS
jgi:hypothetical protein